MNPPMSRRERLRRCYCHEETDRPAVFSRTGFPDDDPTYNRLKGLLKENEMFPSIFSDELRMDIGEVLPVIRSWGLNHVDLRGRVFGTAAGTVGRGKTEDEKGASHRQAACAGGRFIPAACPK